MSEFELVWKSDFFGITVGELVAAAIVLFGFILMRRFFARAIISRLKIWAELTETDVDDKIIKKGNSSEKTNASSTAFLEVARVYENDFFNDMDTLNVPIPCISIELP